MSVKMEIDMRYSDRDFYKILEGSIVACHFFILLTLVGHRYFVWNHFSISAAAVIVDRNFDLQLKDGYKHLLWFIFGLAEGVFRSWH